MSAVSARLKALERRALPVTGGKPKTALLRDLAGVSDAELAKLAAGVPEPDKHERHRLARFTDAELARVLPPVLRGVRV